MSCARSGQRLLLGVFAVVLVSDQLTKWWAWRHVGGSLINSGGYILLGPMIRSWFAATVSGAVADVAGVIVVVLAVRWLVQPERRRPELLSGGLVAAGLLSNLLDRLGLRAWTAPGSARGVVDFIPSGGTSRGNVADAWITVGTVLLGAALVRRRRSRSRSRSRTEPTTSGGAPARSREHRLVFRVVAGAAVATAIALAVHSAARGGGSFAPTGQRAAGGVAGSSCCASAVAGDAAEAGSVPSADSCTSSSDTSCSDSS
jgi:lipoprotein signal peptidase